MKICLFSVVSCNGGAEKVMAHLANCFTERNIGVTFASLYDRGFYELNDNVEKVIISKNKCGAFKELKLIREFLNKNKFDYIIAFSYPICIKIALATVFSKTKKDIIMSERNDPARNITNPIKKVLRLWAYKRSAKMVFQTEEARNFFPKSIRKKSAIIPNPLVLPVVPVSDHMSSKRIVAAGRYNEQKNFSLLIKAFNLFNASFPEFSLDIYGAIDSPGEYLKLQELIKNLNLDNKVHLNDFSHDILKEYSTSYIFASSSDYEGISNSMIEAMACGIPVVCTDCPCGGARLAIKNYENGILVAVGSADEMAHAFLELASDRSLASHIGGNAKKVVSTFSLDNIADEWLRFIKNDKK